VANQFLIKEIVLEIQAENVEFIYDPGTPLEQRVLKDISFTISSGAVVGILGSSGSGKTTLVRNLNGLLEPTNGIVLVGGIDTRKYGPELRRRVGLVFQRPERQLFEETVFKDISFVLRRFSKWSEREIFDRVEHAAGLVGLNIIEVGSRCPMALSEGERRKVAIAGILANEPEVLILDEPAVGLDLPSVASLVSLIQEIKHSGGRTVVVVSHDLDAFLTVLDTVIVLDHGRLAAFGSPMEVCTALGADPRMRPFLPEPALLLYDLHKMGVPVDVNEFRIPVLAQQLSAFLVRMAGNPGTG